MKPDITTMEIMEFLMEFEERLNQRFKQIDESLDRIELRLDRIEERLDRVEQRLDYHDTRLKNIEENMVSKNQFNSLIGILKRNSAISEFEVAHVSYEGF